MVLRWHTLSKVRDGPFQHLNLYVYHSSLLGISIAAYASINGSNVNTNITYSLDNGTAVPYTIKSGTAGVTLSHQEIFALGPLADGNHTVEITILTQTIASDFHFDYFLVQASANTSIENSPTSQLFIDDTSTFLVYAPIADWTNTTPNLVPNWPQSDIVNNGTSTRALKAGANVSFTFIGQIASPS